MTIFGIKINVEHLYVYSVVLAFGLLFFANSDSLINTPEEAITKLGIGKMFYYPCGVAMLCSLFMPIKKDVYSTLILGILLAVSISALLHPPVSNNVLTMTLTRFVFAILCFKNVANINPYLFARITAIASPFIIMPHYIWSDPFDYGLYRYGGFYGDANFLALALLVIIFMCIISYKRENSVYLKILYVISIIASIPLIFLGRSRSGMISLILMLIIVLKDIRKKSAWLSWFVVLITVFSFIMLYKTFDESFLLAIQRFSSESDSDVASAQYRLDGIFGAIRVFASNPLLIPFGIGLGNTADMMYYYSNMGYHTEYVIHNTFVSIMYEAGIIVAVLYCFFYYKILGRIIASRDIILFGLFVSLFLALFTLPGAVFMPGWIALFFLCNGNLYEINSDNDQR